MKHSGLKGDSIPEYATFRGVTKAAVYAAKKRNRVVTYEDGSIDRTMTDLAWPRQHRPDKKKAMQLGDYETERTRKMRADANHAEMRNAEKRGDLISVAVVRSLFLTVATNTRDSLFTMVDRVTPLLISEDSAHAIDRILRAEIEKTCEKLNTNTLDLAGGDNVANE